MSNDNIPLIGCVGCLWFLGIISGGTGMLLIMLIILFL